MNRVNPTGISGRSLQLAPMLVLLAGCAGGPQLPVRTAGEAAAPLSLTMLHARTGPHGIAVTGMVRARTGSGTGSASLPALPGPLRIAARRADGTVAAASCIRWAPVHHRTRTWAPFTARLRVAEPATIHEITAEYLAPPATACELAPQGSEPD